MFVIHATVMFPNYAAPLGLGYSIGCVGYKHAAPTALTG